MYNYKRPFRLVLSPDGVQEIHDANGYVLLTDIVNILNAPPAAPVDHGERERAIESLRAYCRGRDTLASFTVSQMFERVLATPNPAAPVAPAAGEDDAWPPRSCVAALVRAVTHLLDDHNCDTDKHEEFIDARRKAEAWLAAPPATVKGDKPLTPTADAQHRLYGQHGSTDKPVAAGEAMAEAMKHPGVKDAVALQAATERWLAQPARESEGADAKTRLYRALTKQRVGLIGPDGAPQVFWKEFSEAYDATHAATPPASEAEEAAREMESEAAYWRLPNITEREDCTAGIAEQIARYYDLAASALRRSEVTGGAVVLPDGWTIDGEVTVRIIGPRDVRGMRPTGAGRGPTFANALEEAMKNAAAMNPYCAAALSAALGRK